MKKQKSYCTYIMTNKRITVFYTGISGNLRKRHSQHKYKLKNGFTKKYNIDKLVYYECFDNPNDAIVREKEIKAWRREKKINLIKSMNPEFKDLFEEWMKLWAMGLLKSKIVYFLTPRDPSSLRSSG